MVTDGTNGEIPAFSEARKYFLTEKGKRLVEYIIAQSMGGVALQDIADQLGLTTEHLQIMLIVDAAQEEREAEARATQNPSDQ